MLGGGVTGITLVYAEKVKFIAFTFRPSHADLSGAPAAWTEAGVPVRWGYSSGTPPAP
jgi:hypothetical protein